MPKKVLKELCSLDGLNVYVERLSGCFDVVEDFFVGDDLWFVMFASGSLAVECCGKCLGFDSSGAC
jgi:hypothetical protein